MAAASGAVFTAVVLRQLANAFACRSTARWPGALGSASNRMLLAAVTAELAALAMLLFLPPMATSWTRRPPPLAVGPIAMLAIPDVLGVDAAHKRLLARRRTR